MVTEIKDSALVQRRWRLLGATAIGAFMAPFDGSVVSVALPRIAPALRLSFVGALWVQASYLLALTVFLIPAGRLADMLGGLRLYRLGAVLFALFSAGAGAALSPAWLLGARVGQGVAAALLSATSTALVTEAFPSQERGKALGLNVTAVYVGLSLGPVLGGLLTQYVGWRSIFYVNLPVAAATLAWGWRLGGERRAADANLDLRGAALLMAALTSIMVGVTLAPLWGWASGQTIGVVSLGAACLAGFVPLEARSDHPVVDVRLFVRNRLYATANFAALANYVAFFAITVLTAVFLEVVDARSPEATGLVLVGEPVVMVLFSSGAGRLSDVIGSRWLASGGMAIIGAGLLLLSRLSPRTPTSLLIGELAIIGLGMAAFSSPNTSAVMGSVARSQLGVASGTIGTMRFLGQALSVAVLGAIATVHLGAAGQAVLFLGTGTRQDAAAFAAGYGLAMRVAAGVAFVGAVASLTRGPRGQATP